MFTLIMTAGIAFLAVGGVFCAYQIYKTVEADAKSRGLKHPKLWGLLSTSGNNQSGLLLYLIGRRKYAAEQLTQQQQDEMSARKKKIGVGLIFLSIGAIICIWCIMTTP